MTDPSPLHQLQRDVQAQLPDVTATIDGPPRDVGGVWWLDLSVGGRRINVEWSPTRHFGVHANDSDGYGESPDETFEGYPDALEYVSQYVSAARDEPICLRRYVWMLRFLSNAGTPQDLQKVTSLYVFDTSYDPLDVRKAYDRIRREKGWR